MPLVIRGVVFDAGVVGEFEGRAGSPGLLRWLGGGGGGGRVVVRLRVYRVGRVGLVVQRLPSRRVYVHWEPVARIVGFGGLVCRFHEGPPGVVEEQLYCVRPAVAEGGFCEEHARSPLALYERCVAGSDADCIRVSGVWPDEEYAVYVLDYGSDRVKVGLTRGWRLLWRIAEQPHVSVAVVGRYRGDLFAARVFERELGRKSIAGEGGGVRVWDRLLSSASFLESVSLDRLAPRLAELLARLGVGPGVYEAYTVLPRGGVGGVRVFLSARRVRGLEELLDRRLHVKDYWAGLVLVEDIDSGEELVVDKRVVLHRVLRTQRG